MHYPQLQQAWTELTGAGSPFEVVEQPVLGRPNKSFRHAPPNMRALWLSTAPFADRDYLITGDERTTYAQAHQQVAAIANWLLAQGVTPGDRVAIAMRNLPEWMLVYWACACLGVAVVGMNAWWTTAEIEYCVDDSEPKLIFADAERAQRIRASSRLSESCKVVVCRGNALEEAAWSEILATRGALPDAAIDPDDDLCIFYTSGTTGSSKGAQLTHRGSINNILNIAFAAEAHALAAEKATGQPRVPAPEIPSLLVTVPLFHVTANNCGAHPITVTGGKLIMMHRWDAGEALRLIEQEKCTTFGGVPVMARELISHPDFDKYDTSTIQTLGGGGAQLPPDLAARIDTRSSSARPTTGYGMTETCGMISWITGDFFVDKPQSCGRAAPTFDVKIVDQDENDLPPGAPGELLVRGASVIKGYLNRQEDIDETICDGWLRTGDVAYLDEDQFIFLVDRKKDMVLRGGENVYCAEVEAALYRNAEVAECSVFGVPDDRLGEEVGAAIFLGAGAALSADDLRSHCAPLIAKHKIPRYIWILDQPLPRNATGKFLKTELRQVLDTSSAA